MTSREVYPGCAILFRLRSPKIEIDARFLRVSPHAHRRALPTAEDLVACDRITLYSTKFAAFIKSPLDIGIGGEEKCPESLPSWHYLSALSLKIPLPAYPRTLMPLTVVYDYQFSPANVSCLSFVARRLMVNRCDGEPTSLA